MNYFQNIGFQMRDALFRMQNFLKTPHLCMHIWMPIYYFKTIEQIMSIYYTLLKFLFPLPLPCLKYKQLNIV